MLLNLIDIIMLAADECPQHWSFCYLLLDIVIDADYSISGVLFHGHIFTYCLTTGRGPWVNAEWRKNCWLTCRHNNVLCCTQMIWTTCCNFHWYCMMTAFTACTIAVQIWRCVAAVSLMHIHSLPATSTDCCSVICNSWLYLCRDVCEKRINAFCMYIII